MAHGLIISAWWAATPDRNMTRVTKTKDLCWEADQLIPWVPSKKTCFMGNTVAAPWGEKNQVQRSCRLANWSEVVRHSQNIPFYSCFISEFSWWNGTASHFVLPAVERQNVTPRNKKREMKKKKDTFNVERCIFNLCHGHKSKSPKFHETCRPTSLRLYFFILFVVMQLWKLKAKGLWQSYWN